MLFISVLPRIFLRSSGGGAGMRAREVGEMLGTANLFLFSLCVRSSPLGKEVKQERNVRINKNKNNEKERKRGKGGRNQE